LRSSAKADRVVGAGRIDAASRLALIRRRGRAESTDFSTGTTATGRRRRRRGATKADGGIGTDGVDAAAGVALVKGRSRAGPAVVLGARAATAAAGRRRRRGRRRAAALTVDGHPVDLDPVVHLSSRAPVRRSPGPGDSSLGCSRAGIPEIKDDFGGSAREEVAEGRSGEVPNFVSVDLPFDEIGLAFDADCLVVGEGVADAVVLAVDAVDQAVLGEKVGLDLDTKSEVLN